MQSIQNLSVPPVMNKKIVVGQDEWCLVQPLIFDENGKYQPEIEIVDTYWNGPFDIWLYMPEGQVLIDLLKSEGIPFSIPFVQNRG